MTDLLTLFVRHPLLALVPGLLFLLAAAHRRHRVVGVAAGAWLLYALYELGVSHRLLCSGECNVRADLVLLYPLLLGLSAAAVLASLRGRGPKPERGTLGTR